MITDCINALHQPIKQMKGKLELIAALLAIWAIAACTSVSEKICVQQTQGLLLLHPKALLLAP